MIDEAAIQHDIAFLVAADPRLDAGGPVAVETVAPGFSGLVHLILGQQVSIEAADAMYARLQSLGPVTPDAFLSLDDVALRASGFTRMKAGYARALARAVLDGFELEAVTDTDPESAVAALTELPGIGRWTAECYLIFSVGHRDVFPAGDLALRIGWQEIATLPQPPSEAQLRVTAQQWAPRRSAAAHLIWEKYLRARGRR